MEYDTTTARVKKTKLLDLMATGYIKVERVSRRLSYLGMMQNIIRYYRNPDRYVKYHLSMESEQIVRDLLEKDLVRFNAMPKPGEFLWQEALRDFYSDGLLSINSQINSRMVASDRYKWRDFRQHKRMSIPDEAGRAIYQEIKKVMDQIAAMLETPAGQ